MSQTSQRTRIADKVRELDLGSVWKRLDMFGVSLPMFNIHGQTVTNTVCGGVASFVVLFIFFLYATLKLSHLLSKYNPDISTVVETNFYDQNTRLRLGDLDFSIAFTIEGYLDKKAKNDPKFVKTMARIVTYTDGVSSERFIPFSKCTKAQLDRFSPPAHGMQEQIDKITSDPDRGLFCFDDKSLSDLEIYGDGDTSSEHTRIEFLLLPCNYIHAYEGYKDSINTECNFDKQAQTDYLGTLDWKIYHDQQIFNPRGYGDEIITKNSILYNQQVDFLNPNWFRNEININEVADESELLQLGIVSEQAFYELTHELPVASSWNTFPTRENPSTRYKYTSFEIQLGKNKTVVERQTYSLLDWLGDLGGLFDALKIICNWFVAPVATYALKATLMTKFFLL